MKTNNFAIGDKVVYNGEKFRSSLKNKIGDVCSKVANEDGAYVIDFPEDSFIIDGNNLQLWKSSSGKDEPVVIRRKHKSDDE